MRILRGKRNLSLMQWRKIGDDILIVYRIKA